MTLVCSDNLDGPYPSIIFEDERYLYLFYQEGTNMSRPRLVLFPAGYPIAEKEYCIIWNEGDAVAGYELPGITIDWYALARNPLPYVIEAML